VPKGPSIRPQEEREFFLNFLEESEKQRDEYRDIDAEVIQHYMVQPEDYGGALSGRSVLADPETHIMVETLLARLYVSSFGTRGFVASEPVGREDAFASILVNGILERIQRLKMNRHNSYVTLKDAVLRGCGLIAPAWRYEEADVPRRVFSVDPFTGDEFSEVQVHTVAAWDDVWYENVDLDDFFPDPGRNMIADMLGGARRYILPEMEALSMVEQGRWKKDAVNKAIESRVRDRKVGRDGVESVRHDRDDDYREGIDRPMYREITEDWNPMVAYTGWFQVPYRHKDGFERRRLTLLNGELVESRGKIEPIRQLVPIQEFVINPIGGRFRGVAPAAVARFTQDFLNALLILTADATVKKVRAPVIYDPLSIRGEEVFKLQKWLGPIAADNMHANSVRELRYDVPLGEAFALLSALKQDQRQGSSAQDAIAGRGLGTKRISATEAQLQTEAAGDRPTMMQMLLEGEAWPGLAKMAFELSQFFIDSTDSLRQRVGRSNVTGRTPYPEDISGDFDVEFVGAAQLPSKQVQLQFLERGMQLAGSIPGVAPIYPWGEAFLEWFELTGQRKLEAMVADPNGVEDFIDRQMRVGQAGENPAAGNGNNAPAQLGPSGLAPAQAAGDVAIA